MVKTISKQKIIITNGGLNKIIKNHIELLTSINRITK